MSTNPTPGDRPAYGADSEVGRLGTVMLHRPGNELKRLTPRNNDRLLFDGIPWVARAQDEHDAFAAEWGDLSQLLTISLVGRYHDPWSVFLGAWGALLLVSGLAVVAGRFLLQHMRLSTIHYVGAAVFLVLAGVTAYQLISG